MALYEYFCPMHGTIELIHSMKDPAVQFCPKCKEENNTETPIKRLISSSSFILSGEGWASSGYSKH